MTSPYSISSNSVVPNIAQIPNDLIDTRVQSQRIAGVELLGNLVTQVAPPANEVFGQSTPIRYGAKNGYAHIVYERSNPKEPLIKLLQKENGQYSYVYFKPTSGGNLSTLAFQLLFNDSIFPLSAKKAVPAPTNPSAPSSGPGTLGGALTRELLPPSFTETPTPVVFKSDEELLETAKAYPKSGGGVIVKVLDRINAAADDPNQVQFRKQLRELMNTPNAIMKWSLDDGSKVTLQQVNGKLRVTVQLPVSAQTYVRSIPAPDGNPTWQPSNGPTFKRLGSDTDIQSAAKADPKSPAALMERTLNSINAAADYKADTSLRDVLRKIMACYALK
jgi:hypothetical protein